MKVANRILINFLLPQILSWGALSLCWWYEIKLREVKVSLGWALNLFSVSWGTDVLKAKYYRCSG